MGTLGIGAIDADLLKNNPPTHSTFYKTNLLAVLNQTGCLGIRFLSASVVVDGVSRDTVVAVGYTSGGNLTDMIRYDALPCPPHCHQPGTTSAPDPDRSIVIGDAANILTSRTFAAKFSKDDLETLLGLDGVDKIRVYYGWTTAEQDKPTFFLQGSSFGEPVVNMYGVDESPEEGATL
jgi:hypothetical protein